MCAIQLKTLLITALITLTYVTYGQSEKLQNERYIPTVLQPNKVMANVKVNIAQTLRKAEFWDIKSKTGGDLKDVLVMDDRIELKVKNQNIIINFSDLVDDVIIAQQNHKILSDGLHYQRLISELHLSNYIFTFKGKYDCSDLADDLFFILQPVKDKRYIAQLTLFEPIAAEYRSLKVKPQISEEQRKFIVQANMFNQEKAYDKAIEVYDKVVELDQTAYPAAYSNLALLSAQLDKFDAAIFYMKKYLLLEPEAQDVRAAQDKIYEWEAKITR